MKTHQKTKKCTVESNRILNEANGAEPIRALEIIPPMIPTAVQGENIREGHQMQNEGDRVQAIQDLPNISFQNMKICCDKCNSMITRQNMKTHQKTKKCSSEFARIQVANVTVQLANVTIQPEIQEEVVIMQPEVAEVDLPITQPMIQEPNMTEEPNVQEEGE